MVQGDDGTPVFYRPDGTCVEVAPRTHHRGADPSTPTHADSIVVGPCTAMTRGDDAPLDVGWAVDILRDSPVRRARQHRAAAVCPASDGERVVASS